ncbi:putative lipoprotein [Neisseria flavescens]|nr:putative lipoprotein [Neisseria flavescens]
MLAACSSSKTEEAAAPRITVEEAMTQCQQASGENADRAVFDACMKDKGYQRTAESAASEPAASEPVAAPETAAPEAAASEPAAKAAPAKKAVKKVKK